MVKATFSFWQAQNAGYRRSARGAGWLAVVLMLAGCGADEAARNHRKVEAAWADLAERGSLGGRAGEVGGLTDRWGLNLLHRAAFWGDPNMLGALLEHYQDLDVPLGSTGESAMQIAAQWGHVASVEMLLAKGANANHRDQIGRTALMKMSRGGTMIRPEPFCSTMETEARNRSARDLPFIPKERARMDEVLSIIEMLLKHGASLEMRDMEGNTALSEAAKSGRGEILRLLQEHAATASQQPKKE